MQAVALAALATAPMAGCDLLDRGPDTPPAPDPLAPLASGAQELAIRYEAAIAAHPELAGQIEPVARAHREHAAELARVAGVALPSPGPGSSPTTPTGDAKATLAALRAAEQDARTAAAQACLSAPADRAALLGSIAAACTTHLEVVR